jgi:hypothetical protein
MQRQSLSLLLRLDTTFPFRHARKLGAQCASRPWCAYLHASILPGRELLPLHLSSAAGSGQTLGQNLGNPLKEPS